MGKYHPALEWSLGILYLVLILYGLWHLGGWLYIEAMNLTPKKLALGGVMLTSVPFAFLIIFGMAGQQNGMTVAGALTILSFWVSVPSLAIAGVWYLVRI